MHDDLHVEVKQFQHIHIVFASDKQNSYRVHFQLMMSHEIFFLQKKTTLSIDVV